MVILHLFSSSGSEPDDMRRQIMVIQTPICHPETIESSGTQRQSMVILRLLSSIGGGPDGTQRQIMVIQHLLSSRGGEPDDTQRQIMVILLTFCHPDTVVSDGTQRQIMVILLTFCHPDTVVSDGTQRQIMVILRLLSS